MKFRPLHDRVVIERIDAEAKTAGGIIIPDTAQEEAAARQGHRRWTRRPRRERQALPIDIKVGDRILFGKWSGTGSNRARGSGAICTPTRADGR
jgi:chaperonin GroES